MGGESLARSWVRGLHSAIIGAVVARPGTRAAQHWRRSRSLPGDRGGVDDEGSESVKRNDSLVKLISGSILFVVLVALGLLTGCTDDGIRTAQAHGFTDIETTGTLRVE